MLIDMYVTKVGQRKHLESPTLILGSGLAQSVSARPYLRSLNTRKTSTDGESGGGGGGGGGGGVKWVS